MLARRTMRSRLLSPAIARARSVVSFLLAAFMAVLAAGCGSGGTLQVTKIAAAADPPSNVAVYVDVKDKLGRPVPGLAEKNFRVYEDGKLVTTSKGKRALLEPKQFDSRYVLLLVDMSGPIVDSEDLPELAGAIGDFVDH